MDRMGSVPNLLVKRSISIDTMLNFDGDRHGHGDCEGTVNRPLQYVFYNQNREKEKTNITHLKTVVRLSW